MFYDTLASETDVEMRATNAMETERLEQTRKAFVRKVMSIVTCIVAFYVTVVVVGIQNVDFCRWFFFSHVGLTVVVIAVVVNFCCSMAISCIQSIGRAYPMNYITLLASVLSSAVILLGTVTVELTHYGGDSKLILTALGTTAICIGCLTFFASATGWDMTKYVAVVGIAVIVLIITMLGGYLVGHSFFSEQVYFALLGATSCMYIVIYTQALLNPKGYYSLTEDDYILAVLMIQALYLDLFLTILRLMSRRERD